MKRRFSILNFFVLIHHFFELPSLTMGDGACPPQSSSFLTLSDYEKYAQENLPKGLRDYITRGAGDELTLRGNIEGFGKFKVLPRYLRDISNRTTQVEILGRQFSMPIGISPSGIHKRWHVNGEKETVRGSGESGSILIMSLASSTLMEEMTAPAAAVGGPDGAEMWIQCAIFENLTMTLDCIQRAKAAGFRAVVVAIDQSSGALRPWNIRNKFKDVHKRVNLEPYFEQGATGAKSISWDDVRMMVSWDIMPVILKGILTPEDAILAKEAGARGIIVSNHGGRQLDGAISSIEALHMIGQQHPELVAKETNNNFDIYLDSGVRSGLDVFRALALGAKFVFVGRAPLWGLYHSGHQGVSAVLDILRRELDTIMGQAGCRTVSCIEPALLKYYP